MNRNIQIIIYLFLIFFSSCKQKIDRDLFSIPVEIKVVNLHADTLYQTYIGEIKEEYSSSLSFSVPGNVERIYVNEGEYVNKGTLLASLDKENLQSTYDASLAMLKQAEDAYSRLHKLYEKGSLPEIQWMEMLTNLEKARSAEKIAKKNLAESDLYAPFSGIIGKKNIEMGMYAMPSMSAITLLNTNNVVVKVPIPENIISSIKFGQKAKISISALDNMELEGQVDMKGIVSNLITHTYNINIPIANKDKKLMPGMICKVQFVSGDTSQVIVLPVQVVKLSHTGEYFVWTVKNNQAHKRIVEIGELTDFGIVVQRGLQENDTVIVKGYQKVSENTQLIIQ